MIKNTLKLIKNFCLLNFKAIRNLIRHDGVEHAGYLAFVTLLSFFPFLMFLMAVTGFIDKSDYGKDLINSLISIMPEDLILAIKPRIEEIISVPPKSLLTISILGMIWTSSSIVEGIKTILNRVYSIASPPAYIWRRLLSILQFFLLTAILIISSFTLILLPAVYETISHFKHLKPLFDTLTSFGQGILAPIWDNARQLTFVITLFSSVMFLYYTIPSVKMSLRSLIPGSLLTVILWITSAMLFSKYLYLFSQLNLVYGSLASFIITLLFFYLIHLIFIYGAEVNMLLSQKNKKKLAQNQLI